ncbi:MAG TPA: polymer-forming cytoskeletal protein [Ktedonobacteraceae bacterium]|nr:polymer-forming cytoskeletal protein [Ktedonobacteraceae bacterium]
MLKAGRLRWFALLMLIPALVAGIVEEVQGQSQSLLPWATPSVLAADRNVEESWDDCSNEHQGPSLGGTVVVDTHQLVCNDLTAFGGTVVIDGEVRRDVVVFDGNVVIAGTVDGNVDLYGGTVTLQNGSHVHGDINLYAGDSTQSNGAQLDGAVIYHTRHVGWLLLSSGEFSFPFWPILTWVALGLLLTWLLPEHVMFVRTTVIVKPQRSLLIGLLSALMTLPVMVVLIALILTIPVAILVALGLIAAWALGTVAIGWVVGEHVVRLVAPHRNKRPVQVVVGLTVLVLAGSLPYIGFWISIGAGLLGLGAVFLSRFGTRLYSQPKQPLTL